MREPFVPRPISRRGLLALGLSAVTAPVFASRSMRPWELHRDLLELAARQQARRRARFAAVATKDDLSALQDSLRATFLDLLDGLPTANGPPPTRTLGRLQGEGYVVEKLVFESFPGFFVTALLYRPEGLTEPTPGILSPCGHSTVGKAANTYQLLHINLAKRGYVVLTYDPVGQGERSQFWDSDRARSRFNLSCGEHAVLGNPLYLLGTSLARYRIWDGMRGLDVLTSLPGVDPARIGCVGNSGGGTLTAYLAALDPRIGVPVIGCYITSLPRRMANRIAADPDADPEQDVEGFVSRGIDHAGLLAMLAPRPTLLCTALRDFFPIEGARETFDEARRLYEVAGAKKRIERVEAPERHGLSRPLREAAYAWFDRWLGRAEGEPRDVEIPVVPRAASELQVCPEGQVASSFHSRPLLSVALEEFRKRGARKRAPLEDVLRLDLDQADYRLETLANGSDPGASLILCVNGNEAADWRREKPFLATLTKAGHGVAVVDPRGVGASTLDWEIRGHAYDDPLCGVEENLAYNAFLVGKSLLGMRVADVIRAVAVESTRSRPRRIVLCARRDAALVAILAAAVEPRIDRLAVEEAVLTYMPLFDPAGHAINAASILPRLLRDFGDIPEVLAMLAPRRAFAAAPRFAPGRAFPMVWVVEERFTEKPAALLEWLSAN